LGCEEICIVSGKEHSGQIMNQLGSGGDFNVDFTYKVQDKPGGIAQALGLCKSFSNNDSIAVCLGDNIFEDEISIDDYDNKGAYIFLKEVDDPQRFGVAEVVGNSVVGIEEKPKDPKSNLCVTGLYVYDSYVWNVIDGIQPSDRGELEITDVNSWYVKNGLMKFKEIQGFWSDAGTPDSLIIANNLVKKKYKVD
jgi:glucose-1-phosphate thymidylyltransferase